MNALHYLLTNLDQFKVRFYLVLLAGIANGVANFLIPVVLAEFTKHSLTTPHAVRTISLIVGLYIFALIVSYIVRGTGEALAYQFANHLRVKYFQKLCLLPATQLRKVHSGYVLSLINKVSDGYTDIIFALIWNIIPGLVVAALFFGFIARESWVLAGVNAVIVVVFLGLSLLLSRRMVPLASELNTRRASLLSSYVDFMANIVTVKKLGISRYADNHLQEKTQHNYKQISKLQTFHTRRWFLLHSLFGVAFVATISFIVWQIGQGLATAAVLILFVSAYGTLRSLIETLSENVKAFLEMKAYLSQLQEITGETVQQKGKKLRTWRSIQLKDITFQYEDGVAVRVPQFGLTARQKIGITGKSGQGKSTFINLFTNSLQTSHGQRTIDVYDYTQVHPAFFEQNVAMVAQDTELFNMSVRDNLTVGRTVSDETLLGLLAEIDLADWCQQLSEGLDTVVGEKGIKLSAGQRQRLSILRAVLLDRSIYILDEPTSHLDSHTEDIVVKFLSKHLKHKAAIIITHRPALLRLCDTTYEMKNHTLRKVGREAA